MSWSSLPLSPLSNPLGDDQFAQPPNLPTRPTLQDLQAMGLGDAHASTNFEGKYEEALTVQNMWLRWYQSFTPLFTTLVSCLLAAEGSKADLLKVVAATLGKLPSLPNIIGEHTQVIDEEYEGVWQLKVYADWVYWAQKAVRVYETLAEMVAGKCPVAPDGTEKEGVDFADDLGIGRLRLSDEEEANDKELQANIELWLLPLLKLAEADVETCNMCNS